jgi:hypothetical protein
VKLLEQSGKPDEAGVEAFVAEMETWCRLRLTEQNEPGTPVYQSERVQFKNWYKRPKGPVTHPTFWVATVTWSRDPDVDWLAIRGKFPGLLTWLNPEPDTSELESQVS